MFGFSTVELFLSDFGPALCATFFAPTAFAETFFEVVDFCFLDGVFLVVTREERTVDFVILCALLSSFVITFLLAFFNFDTDDLHCGGIAVVRVTRRNGHEYVEPIHNLTKDSVAVVQMWCGKVCDEKL